MDLGKQVSFKWSGRERTVQVWQGGKWDGRKEETLGLSFPGKGSPISEGQQYVFQDGGCFTLNLALHFQ